MTFIERFNYLKENYGSKADLSGVDTNIAAQFTMTDDDCHGIFYIAHLNGVTSVEPYDYHDNTVAVTINSRLLEKIFKGEVDPVASFLAGEFEVEGETDHALKLINAFKASANKKTNK